MIRKMSNKCFNLQKVLIQTNVYVNIKMKEGVIQMKKKLIDLGGLLLFYFVLIIGVLLLNLRFSYINNNSNFNSNYHSYVGVNN